MRYLSLVFISFLLNIPVFSQTSEQKVLIEKIKNLRASVLKEKVTDIKKVKNDSLRQTVAAYLNTPNSFNTQLDSVSYLGDLYSPDGEFRIITWNIGYKDMTNDYFAFVQKKTKNKSTVWFELKDKSAQQFRTIDFKNFNHKNWFGALYYEIVPFKHKRKNYYILLGWDGNNKMSNKKIIEVLYFDRKNQPRFGANVFKSEGKSKKRIVLQYTKDAFVSLRYHPKKKTIIFDHLRPIKPELEGMYEFYAPDLSYDGYKLKGGKWVLVEAIDVYGKKQEKYNDPRTIKEPIEKK